MNEVVVVGGGIVGASAAYHLARKGTSVTLVDRDDVGRATAAGAGIICPGTATAPGEPAFDLYLAAARFYPAMLAQLAEDGESETGYAETGALVVATDDIEAEGLAEAAALAHAVRDAGMPGVGEVSRTSGDDARRLFPALGRVAGAVHIAGAGRVNGRLLRDALQRAAEKHGATLVRGNAGVAVDGGRATVEVDGRPIRSEAVLIAAGAWSGGLDAGLPVYPQRGQILHVDLPATETSRWPVILGFRGHYILTFPPNRVVAGATREHDSGYDVRMTAGGVHQTLGEMLRVAPGLAGGTLVEVRVGLRPASPDGLPILGKLPGVENLYVATGHGPVGLQLGPYSGALVADLALGGACADFTRRVRARAVRVASRRLGPARE